MVKKVEKYIPPKTKNTSLAARSAADECFQAGRGRPEPQRHHISAIH